VSDRLAGLLLFLPVPLVLFLFTQAPLGVLPSLLVGLALVATHRLYARPFALARGERRCLWCGGAAAAGSGPLVALVEPLGPTRWRACSAAHADRLARVLAFAEAHAGALKLGILGTLLTFLVLVVPADRGRLGPLTTADLVALFRGGIALSVLPLGWLSLRSSPPPEGAAKLPFPVHIQALIGTAGVLWLFRLVGLAWLALAVLQLTRRLAGTGV
jgi:hypothetical protein